MNVPFNNKITRLSYENSGLDSPEGVIYNFQSAIVPRERMNHGQPFIIADINNPTDNLRVGLLNKNNLSFRLFQPSHAFITPVIENPENYLFFDYNKVMQMTMVSYPDEPLSKFTYLLGDAPILYSNRGLHPIPLIQLNDDTEYIVVSKETSQMYRGKCSHMVNNGALFEFKIDKLPFIVKVVVNDLSCEFYTNNTTSLVRLSNISLLNRDRASLKVDNARYVNKQKTMRWVKSSSRNRSRTKQESCVTILLIAHGTIYKNLKIDRKLMKNVNISLMAGGAGIYGLGGNFRNSHVVIDNIHYTTKKYTIPGYKSRTDMSIDMISKIYPDLLEKYYPVKTKCSTQFFSMFENIVDYLKVFYPLVGINTFPRQGEFGENDDGIDMSLVKQRRNSFSIFTSFNDKILQFYPDKYQNCLETVTRKDDCVLIEPEDNRELSFGISILQSSDPYDFNYTLAGMSVNGESYKHANLTNWSQDHVRNNWRNKLVANTALLSKPWRDYYMELYNTISTPLDPNGMYEDADTKETITMSEVIDLFKEGMGFTHVNIIDYSCNSCTTPLSNLKLGLIDVVGSHPTMKLHRTMKNYVRSNMKNPERVIMDITNPSTQQIIEIVGEKAKSTSYGKKIHRSSIKNTRRVKSFGGKKNKSKNRRR